MFDNLKTNDAIQQDGDFVGGSYILNTDAYKLVIDMAYVDTAASGAMSMNFVLKGQNNETLRQQFWVTSGTAKGCKNTYVDKKNVTHYLPGFSQANNLSLLAIGKELSELIAEDKVLSLYDYTQKKEVPQTKKVLTALLGAEIIVGVERQIVDKTVKDEATGDYLPTGETREVNEIVKTFRARDSLTAAEIRAGETTPVFLAKWVELNKGNIVDKSVGIAATQDAAATATTSDTPEVTKSLF